MDSIFGASDMASTPMIFEDAQDDSMTDSPPSQVLQSETFGIQRTTSLKRKRPAHRVLSDSVLQSIDTALLTPPVSRSNSEVGLSQSQMSAASAPSMSRTTSGASFTFRTSPVETEQTCPSDSEGEEDNTKENAPHMTSPTWIPAHLLTSPRQRQGLNPVPLGELRISHDEEAALVAEIARRQNFAENAKPTSCCTASSSSSCTPSISTCSSSSNPLSISVTLTPSKRRSPRRISSSFHPAKQTGPYSTSPHKSPRKNSSSTSVRPALTSLSPVKPSRILGPHSPSKVSKKPLPLGTHHASATEKLRAKLENARWDLGLKDCRLVAPGGAAARRGSTGSSSSTGGVLRTGLGRL